MAPAGGDVDGPMAGAADVGLAALFERLEGADPVTLVVNRALGRLDHLLENVVEAFVAEIAFFLGDPFLKAEMRLDDKRRHGLRLRRGGGYHRLFAPLKPTGAVRCLTRSSVMAHV